MDSRYLNASNAKNSAILSDRSRTIVSGFVFAAHPRTAQAWPVTSQRMRMMGRGMPMAQRRIERISVSRRRG